MLFKEFAGVDAFPICLALPTTPTRSWPPVKAMPPGFGGINLEDISAPRCFEIESRLKAELDIGLPRDQHGTAVVLLAGAAQFADLTVSGSATSTWSASDSEHGGGRHQHPAGRGVRHIIGCDSARCGALGPNRYLDGTMPPSSVALAEITNLERRRGTPLEVIEGADLLIGVSGARVIPHRRCEHEPRPDRVRDGQSDPGSRPERRCRMCESGHRPPGLPTRSQRAFCVPGDLPGRGSTSARGR